MSDTFPPNISLIGYRGAGKSTVAHKIAEKTGMELRNLDGLIAGKAGLSIPEIVAGKGWEYFRELESQVLEEVMAGNNLVLDCGGGIILRQQNRDLLKKNSTVFWLVASVPAIISRIKQGDQRPSLTGKSFTEEVAEVLAERAPLYREIADHIIDTESLSPSEAAEKIIHFLESGPGAVCR